MKSAAEGPGKNLECKGFQASSLKRYGSLMRSGKRVISGLMLTKTEVRAGIVFGMGKKVKNEAEGNSPRI